MQISQTSVLFQNTADEKVPRDAEGLFCAMGLFAEFFVDVVSEIVHDAGLGLFDIGRKVDYLTIAAEERWRGVELEIRSDGAVEVDFGFDGVAAHVGFKLIDIAFAVGDGFEIRNKIFGALGAGGIKPFGLVREDEITHFFPIALETGGLYGGGGGDSVRVERRDWINPKDDSELAIIFFNELFNPRLEEGASGALIVGIFKEDDLGGFDVSFDMVGNVAVITAGFNGFVEIIFRQIDFRRSRFIVT